MGFLKELQQITSEQDAYTLLKRFKMPTNSGSVDAISVTAGMSRVLLSLYTLMVSIIILHVWYICVLFTMAIVYRNTRNKSLKRNHAVANVAIWNSQASPLSIITAMYNYRAHIPGYASCWAFAAFVAWAGALSISLLISPYLIVGTAAPVNPKSIYLPTNVKPTDNAILYRWNSLKAPQYLRAIETLQSTDGDTGGLTNTAGFKVDTPHNYSGDGENTTMYEMRYAYNITGEELGLQRLPHFKVEVQGSCRTEYSWYKAAESKAVYDIYRLFDSDQEGDMKNISLAPGIKQPTLSVYLKNHTEVPVRNYSFALVVSSSQRYSYTTGRNPWYYTKPYNATLDPPLHVVMNGRPPLSCWEKSLFSNNGSPRVGITEIENLTGMKSGMSTVLVDALSVPVIIRLTQSLGLTYSLKSALGAVGLYFDAESASIHEDLKRLVLGAYIATKNTLVDTTMFDDRYDKEIPNLAIEGEKYRDGVADFVIYGHDLAALSIMMLSLIPSLLIFLWLLINFLTNNPCWPFPWAYLNALQATVLYSELDNESFKGDTSGKWTRESTTPYYRDQDDIALVRPKYERGNYSWVRSDIGSLANTRKYQPEPYQEPDQQSQESMQSPSHTLESYFDHQQSSNGPYEPVSSDEPHGSNMSDHSSQSFELNLFHEATDLYSPIHSPVT